jgi:hypothetical protein
MTITKTLQILLTDGSIESGTVTASGIQPCQLSYVGIEMGELEFSDVDYWGALRELRLYLEARGARALCNGARTDVSPSGLTRSMTGGLSAYITRMNAPSSQEDRVNIFDYAQPELVGTVQQQENFHLEWFRGSFPNFNNSKD